jgi:ABC-type phosphate transport system substrate-binding protein
MLWNKLRARLSGWRAPVAVLAVMLLLLGVSDAPAGAAGFVPINGDGSSWAEPAISQWSRDVTPQGMQIAYAGDGSAQGRSNFIQGIVDFAGSDIAFLTSPDPFGGGTENNEIDYSYIPIVAGGTAFMYNLSVGGQKITNLRLTGDTITKIFTGQITDWADPRITHDYGAQLPSQPIHVVTRSDGSGATYQFTRWMSKQYGPQWNGFCAQHGGPANCPPTEFYPAFGSSVQKNGSDQVASFIAGSLGQGAIGYDEYAYALNDNVPVVKVLNQANFYSLPTPSNVAIALQAALIDPNPASLTFLIQNLDNVYTFGDVRTYPLSSYSYLIVPRDFRPGRYRPLPGFTPAKGATLSSWLNYVLCGAQQSAGQLGYSPLPKNLVVGGFLQDSHIPGAVPTPDTNQLNNCPNPTYHDGVNHLIVDAPLPSPCDYVTAPLNCTVVGGKAVSTGSGLHPGSGNGSPAQGGPAGAGPGAGGAGPGGAGGTGPNGGVPAGSVDPNTGQVIGSDGSTGTAYAASVGLTGHPEQLWLLGTLTALELIGAVVAPTLLGVWWTRRRRQRG